MKKLFWEEPDFLTLAAIAAGLYLIGRPVVSYAAGVVVGAPTDAGARLERAAARAFGKRGYEAIVTSAREGEHMAGSAHPGGNARDFRTWHVRTNAEKEAIAADMRADPELGPRFDVVMEWNPEHMHGELDPTRGSLGYLRRW